jgi:hypothetical protein
MPTAKRTASPFFKTLQDKNAKAREAALYEIKDMRKDLANLEKILQGKKPLGDFSLFDIVHGAFEIFRQGQLVFDNEQLMEEMDKELETEVLKEDLVKRGATLLKKPEGWHWISPKGEMHYLGKPDEIEKSLQTLKELKGGKRKKKAAPKKAQPAAAESGNGGSDKTADKPAKAKGGKAGAEASVGK